MVKTESSKTLKTGQLAPQFRLRGIDGNTYLLDNFRESKSVLVVFICNHCPYVKASIGDLVELQSKFSTNELTEIGINSNDPNYENEGFDNMINFGREYKLNFPYLMDESQTGAKLLPNHTYRRRPYHLEDVSTKFHIHKCRTLYTLHVAKLHPHFHYCNSE